MLAKKKTLLLSFDGTDKMEFEDVVNTGQSEAKHDPVLIADGPETHGRVPQ